MKNAKTTRRALFSSVIALMLCFTMLMGTTFAWFTDSVSSVGNKIQSGTLKIDLLHGEVSLKDETDHKVFNYDKWEPGYTRVETLTVVNEGNLALKYMLTVFSAGGEKLGANGENLANVIDVYMFNGAVDPTRADIAAATPVGTLAELMADPDGAAYGVLLPAGATATAGTLEVVGSQEVTIALKMREEAGNEYQGLSVGDLYISLVATQYTYETDSFDNKYDELAEYPEVEVPADTWDGTVDTSWYNDTDTEFALNTAEQVAGLAELVDGGNTFAGKTIKLEGDVDLYALDANGNRISFDPIGDASSADFSGTFDGNGKTIYNLYQDCNSKHLGLFGAVYEGTVKNLTLDGARVENNGNGYAAGIASYAGASSFENITLKNSTVVNYNHNTAGIVAWCSNNGTTTTFDGINIESTTTIGSWWGSYDTRVGGIVGAMNTGNYVVIKNSTVACQLDVYNDATSNYQWYNYRTAGMVVADVRDTQTINGRTEANPVRVTCENVTVIFDDWANYHYCESATYGTPSYADAGEYKFRRVEAGLGYGGVDLSACNHSADETHNELIAFDYLFGARDGKGQYGINSFNGVTVIYNNK